MQQEKSIWLHGLSALSIYTLLLLISVYLPVLALVGLLLAVVPIAWFRAKYSRINAVFLAILGLLIAILLGGYIGLFIALVIVPVGWIIGDGLAERKSKVFIFVATALTLMVTSLMQILLARVLFEANVIELMIEQIRDTYTQVGDIMESAGQLPDNFNEIVASSLQTFSLVLPGYFIAVMFGTAWLYVALALPILRKLKVPVPRFTAFRHFQLPRAVIWYYLIVSLLSLLATFEAGSFGEMVIVNAVFVFRALLFLQGISLIHFYFHHQGWPKWGAVATTIVALPFYSIVVILGVIDLGFRLRAFIAASPKK
ncbi:DUF2232 domain-containing protein [Chryseomicrobium sp. FSL W7-1435]|uniref:YybS family protein n=1 Tax=Chryseomicrobium sp. FSL W7-1435 TaxID=2921704 RepID=UPI003159CE17